MSTAMTMTIDQKFNFLHASFPEYDTELLFVMLQSNEYSMETTLETLFQMEGQTLLPPNSIERSPPPPPPQPYIESTPVPQPPVPTPASTSQPQSIGKRGARVTLPHDFLRLPRKEQPVNSSILTPGSPEYLTLFSDPVFLAEMEREFGPNFEAVLREHVQAEALRNTAPYSSYISGQQENMPRHTQPSVQQQSTCVNQQSSSLLSQPHQNANLRGNAVPESSTQQPQESTKPMEGFGGGEEAQSTSRSSQSISDRFQNILNKFVPQSNPKPAGGKNSESSGLLASHYEEMSDEERMGEEDSFLQQGDEGVEMQSGFSKSRNDDEIEGDDGTTTLLR